MTVIVCVGDGGSLLFNNRRVSSDRVVTEQILAQYSHREIRMRAYSAKLFADSERVQICEDLLAGDDEDVCFLEEALSADWLDRVSRVVVYHWNRAYPSDVKFPIEQLRSRGSMVSSMEFPGYSHDVITREEYLL